MLNTGLLGSVQHLHMCLMVHAPGIRRQARARGHARHQCIELGASKTIAQHSGGITRIDPAHLGTGQLVLNVLGRSQGVRALAGAQQANHLMALAQQGVCGGRADGAGGTQQHDTQRRSRHQSVPVSKTIQLLLRLTITMIVTRTVTSAEKPTIPAT